MVENFLQDENIPFECEPEKENDQEDFRDLLK